MLDFIDADTACMTLIGDGGIDESVKNNIFTAFEYRAQRRDTQLRPGGEVQKKFGPRRDSDIPCIENKGSDPLAKKRSAGFPKEMHGSPGRTKLIDENSRLSRFSAPIDAFE
jgi:hypothetical protein